MTAPAPNDNLVLRLRETAGNPAICKEAAERISVLERALEPSAETKAAYSGEFYERLEISNPNFDENDENEPETLVQQVPVSWTTIKEIMAAIRALAAPPVAESEAMRERVDTWWIGRHAGEPTKATRMPRVAEIWREQGVYVIEAHAPAEARLAQAEQGPAVTEQWQRDIELALIECERGQTIGDVLANYRSVRRTVMAIREADEAALHSQSAAGEEGK